MLDSRHIVRAVLACAVTMAVVLCSLLAQGCGESKQAQQEFVDGYLSVMEQLQSKPEVAQEGRTAYMAYVSSGFTDLASAQKAQKSYELSSANDKAAQKQLASLTKPDDKAEALAKSLNNGISEVDEGNVKFAADLGKAPTQTVEQRAATAQDIGPAMSSYVKGMTQIVASLAGLKAYATANDLEGEEALTKWHEQIKGELDMVKQYAPQ